MRLRKLTVAALAAFAVAGLAACNTKAGSAAVIDGHRISETQVGDYLTRSGPSPEIVQRAKDQGQVLLPKTIALSYAVQEQVLTRALDKTGDVPSAGELNALHDQAAAELIGTSLTGASLDRAAAQEAAQLGLNGDFATLRIRTLELAKALIDRLKPQNISELAAKVNQLGIAVSVNPRYGKWNPDTLSLKDPRAGIPSFVDLPGVTSSTTPAA